jgi:hypothetical protein
MKSEIQSLVYNKTWSITTLPSNAKALRGKWVYKIKKDVNGTIQKYKARYVVKGYLQRYGIDYDQTFAGVAKGEAWKLVIAVAATMDWEIEQMDAVTAFLQGKIDGDVYVEIPEGISIEVLAKLLNQSIPRGTITLKLNRALYGLKQSPRLWQEKLRTELKKLGFEPFDSDQCIYRSPATKLIIVTYVDNFLIIGPQGKELIKLKLDLANHFDIQDLGPCQYFLGVRVVRNRSERKISLIQDTYIDKVLTRFGMRDAISISTPMEAGATQFVRNEGIASKEDI